jgi:hypothetical protein
MKHAGEAATPLSTLDPAIPKQLSDVVDRMLAKSPDGRYSQPSQILSDLTVKGSLAKTAATKRRQAVAAPRTQGPAPGIRKPGTVKSPPKVAPHRPYVYIAGGGGLVLVGILGMLMFGGEGPVVEGAPLELKKARELIAAGTIASLDEASQRCRDLIARLPTSSRGIEIATEVERVLDRAEYDYLKLVDKDIQQVTVSARKGNTPTSHALERLAALRERYSRPGIPARFKKRGDALLEWAENFLSVTDATEEATAAPAKPPAVEAPPAIEEKVAEADNDLPSPEPALSPTTAALLAEVTGFIDRGDFKGAVAITDAVITAAENAHEREVARTRKAEILKAAQAVYDALSLKVGTDLDLGKVQRAKSAFEAAREGLDFPPYAGMLASLAKRIASRTADTASATAQRPATETKSAETERSEPEPPAVEEEDTAEEEPGEERPAAPPVDEHTAESEIAKALVKAMGLLQNGSFTQVKRLLDDVKQKYGTTKAYRDKKRQLDSIRTMAEAG